MVVINGAIQRFFLALIFFFLLSVADRTFKQVGQPSSYREWGPDLKRGNISVNLHHIIITNNNIKTLVTS